MIEKSIFKDGANKNLTHPTSEKGITLIALVITIIVLLILAGVTINMVLGDDGIIAQAQDAKKEQKDAENKENDAINIAQGNIDLYTTGTLASKVEVGDYVTYNYTAPTNGYTTPANGTGEEVNTKTETFKSGAGENAVVSKWRVLSKKDGIVKLVAETPISTTLTLKGANGYVNGPKVLDEMCKTLYSSDIGTGRSINIEDINEITGYKVPETLTFNIYIDDEYYEQKTIEVPYGTTLKEAVNGTGFIWEYFPSDTPEEGKDIGEYQLTKNTYDGSEQMKTTTDEYKMLFRNLEDNGYLQYYWLASPVFSPWFIANDATFDMLYIYEDQVFTAALYNSNDFDLTPPDECAVRPVVTLKTGLEFSSGDGDVDTPWVIKGN